ncbi:Crp/Fnr family transcriptional regulator [Hymenobacter sp. UV11]|uniref:Crp/Fnr family transcriptional regulator n=1 Tax=Hymenobacter sp. UV11 TaxID=1849735 RepID=UPI00105EB17A|nr:Crp/Fnr family transcriptional regulator [Hymenobacter sp. UV11]TDN37079.1 cyclic nucleotide-binding protein [Hymenobacter sp. UV11]TFZ62683.1 Crp/Fnr family transcriptional regulator [Hymenobacter sp. UV11]
MTHPALENLLLQVAAFRPQQLALISSQAEEKHYPAGAYFAEASRVAREIGFVVSGILRVCYFDKDGRDLTKYLIEEGHFVVDLPSYQYHLPSAEYIQAVTEVQLLVFKASRWQALGQTITNWSKAESILITRALLAKVDRLSPLVQQDARTKYEVFLTLFPSLANRIPLTYLASYIGVTPQSLSRIRKQFPG